MAYFEKRIQSTRWCFTHNNPWLSDHEKHFFAETSVCGAFSVEMAATPHLQGWVVFASNQSLAAMKERCPTCHWEPMRGTEAQAHEYICKEDTHLAGPFQWGREPRSTGKGARTDLRGAIEVACAHGMRRAAQEHPDVIAKYHAGVERVRQLLADPVPPKILRTDQMRPHQLKLHDLLCEDADDRSIIWVTDVPGNSGKSTFARHIYDGGVPGKAGIGLEGKVADMAYVYGGHEIVVFDITRAQAEVSDHLYTFAEKLKNGYVLSTKYEVREKRFKPPHVVFFANKAAPAGVWSADRVVELSWDTQA